MLFKFVCSSVLSRLHTKWLQVNEFRNREAQEDNADTQEVLEDILTRALTREYVDVLKVALVGGGLTPESNSENMETEDLSMDSPTPPPPTRSNMTTEVISDLGQWFTTTYQLINMSHLKRVFHRFGTIAQRKDLSVYSVGSIGCIILDRQ